MVRLTLCRWATAPPSVSVPRLRKRFPNPSKNAHEFPSDLIFDFLLLKQKREKSATAKLLLCSDKLFSRKIIVTLPALSDLSPRALPVDSRSLPVGVQGSEPQRPQRPRWSERARGGRPCRRQPGRQPSRPQQGRRRGRRARQEHQGPQDRRHSAVSTLGVSPALAAVGRCIQRRLCRRAMGASLVITVGGAGRADTTIAVPISSWPITLQTPL